MEEKIAVVSDIHGNSLALEAVMEDIEKLNIKTILNLGDSLYGPLDPERTFQLLSKKNFISISGNQDRFILENEKKVDTQNSTLTFVLNSLPKEAFGWLRELRKEYTWKNIYMCHGSLECDDIPLLEKFDKGEVKPKNHFELKDDVQLLAQSIILCGHTHVPKVMRLPDSHKFIVNPGSVGLPAYDDDFPFYHTMESGSPFAKYTVLEFDDNSIISIAQRHINYDFEGAAKQAKDNGRPDWAYWIKNGVAK